MKVEIYSDVVCPWCYIGKRRFERALAAFPGEVEVVYRPFQLDPDAPAPGVPSLEVLVRKFGPQAEEMADHVTALAAAEGVEFHQEKALAGNTFDAHRLLDLARHEKVQAEVYEGLLRAHFTEGRDITDHTELAAVAADNGIDRDRAAAYLASPEGVSDVQAALERGRRMGITSVPTFVFEGRYAVPGAQEASVFLQALEQVAAEIAASAADDAAETSEDDSARAV